MNERNLKHFTKETAKENGRKGGKASGEAKRVKKKTREILADLMEQEAPAMDTMFSKYEMDFISNRAVIAMRIVDKAKNGDARAIKLLLCLLGELQDTDELVNRETEAFERGYRKGQADIYATMTTDELEAFLDRQLDEKEPKTNEHTLVLPDGRIIYGEDKLED